MNKLSLTLKQPLKYIINCSALTPDHLRHKTATEIGNIVLNHGGSQVCVKDLFEISLDNTSNKELALHIHFKNTSNKLDYLGANMTEGAITIEGDAGAYLGFNLKNGEIHCQGNTEAFAACNMVSGILRINGNTGDFLGAGSEGLRKGMRGGTVIVKGNAGDRVGDQMRRGLILIEGSVGDYCASRMVAGTIGILGNIGAYAAFNMHRGTLLLKSKPQLHATMQDCGTHTLPFLNILFKSFKKYNTEFSNIKTQRVQRFVGDAAYKGNGEVLVLSE